MNVLYHMHLFQQFTIHISEHTVTVIKSPAADM